MVKTGTLFDIWLPTDLSIDGGSLISSATTLLSVSDLVPNKEETERFSSLSKKWSSIAEEEAVEPAKAESELSLYKAPSGVLKESKIFKTACGYVINDCITKLGVVVEIDKSHTIRQTTQPLLYRSLSDRYGKMEESYDSIVIGVVYGNLEKIQKDAAQIIFVLDELIDEIILFSGYTCLDTFVESCLKMEEDELGFMIELGKKKGTIKMLLRALAYDRDEYKKKLQAVDDKVTETTLFFKDFMDEFYGTINYTKKWEDSRYEQNSKIIRQKKEKHESIILNMNQTMREEEVIHEHIEMYCNESRDEYMAEIEKWMESYEKDFENREMKILNMRNDIEKVKSQKENLQQVYDKRQEEMKQWLEYKRVKKEEEIKLSLLTRAAKKIQTWWREVMITKQLGPYKKKKKGKKGGKNGDKKKAKKTKATKK